MHQKAYRFNEKQKAYLDAKFAIGQATGKKLDGDIVACEMRRALGPDGVCLFIVSVALATSLLIKILCHISSITNEPCAAVTSDHTNSV